MLSLLPLLLLQYSSVLHLLLLAPPVDGAGLQRLQELSDGDGFIPINFLVSHVREAVLKAPQPALLGRGADVAGSAAPDPRRPGGGPAGYGPTGGGGRCVPLLSRRVRLDCCAVADVRVDTVPGHPTFSLSHPSTPLSSCSFGAPLQQAQQQPQVPEPPAPLHLPDVPPSLRRILRFLRNCLVLRPAKTGSSKARLAPRHPLSTAVLRLCVQAAAGNLSAYGLPAALSASLPNQHVSAYSLPLGPRALDQTADPLLLLALAAPGEALAQDAGPSSALSLWPSRPAAASVTARARCSAMAEALMAAATAASLAPRAAAAAPAGGASAAGAPGDGTTASPADNAAAAAASDGQDRSAEAWAGLASGRDEGAEGAAGGDADGGLYSYGFGLLEEGGGDGDADGGYGAYALGFDLDLQPEEPAEASSEGAAAATAGAPAQATVAPTAAPGAPSADVAVAAPSAQAAPAASAGTEAAAEEEAVGDSFAFEFDEAAEAPAPAPAEPTPPTPPETATAPAVVADNDMSGSAGARVDPRKRARPAPSPADGTSAGSDVSTGPAGEGPVHAAKRRRIEHGEEESGGGGAGAASGGSLPQHAHIDSPLQLLRWCYTAYQALRAAQAGAPPLAAAPSSGGGCDSSHGSAQPPLPTDRCLALAVRTRVVTGEAEGAYRKIFNAIASGRPGGPRLEGRGGEAGEEGDNQEGGEGGAASGNVGSIVHRERVTHVLMAAGGRTATVDVAAVQGAYVAQGSRFYAPAALAAQGFAFAATRQQAAEAQLPHPAAGAAGRVDPSAVLPPPLPSVHLCSATAALSDEALYAAEAMVPLALLLQEPSIPKAVHCAPDVLPWLQADFGLTCVNAWDCYAALDEVLMAALPAPGAAAPARPPAAGAAPQRAGAGAAAAGAAAAPCLRDAIARSPVCLARSTADQPCYGGSFSPQELASVQQNAVTRSLLAAWFDAVSALRSSRALARAGVSASLPAPLTRAAEWLKQAAMLPRCLQLLREGLSEGRAGGGLSSPAYATLLAAGAAPTAKGEGGLAEAEEAAEAAEQADVALLRGLQALASGTALALAVGAGVCSAAADADSTAPAGWPVAPSVGPAADVIGAALSPDALSRHVRSRLCAQVTGLPLTIAGPAAGAAVPAQGGAWPQALLQTALRSQLSCLRVPAHDPHRGGTLHFPLVSPPWYLRCRDCGAVGAHFELDCPGPGAMAAGGAGGGGAARSDAAAASSAGFSRFGAGAYDHALTLPAAHGAAAYASSAGGGWR
jgi:hypothetical protein